MSPFYHGRCGLNNLSYGLGPGPKLKLTLESDDDLEKFEGLTISRGKKAGQIFTFYWRRKMGKGNKFFQSDAWFAGWNRAHNDGATITFTLKLESWIKLVGEYDGLAKNEPIEIVLVEMEDTGDPVNDDKKQRATSAIRGGPLSQQCGKACNDPVFHRWLEKKHRLKRNKLNAESTAQLIRSLVGGINSRAELDHSATAGAKWQSIYREFLKTYV